MTDNFSKLKNQIPAIHNYYSDLLTSLAYFFDNVIFSPNTIKHYQFNIGNKSIQLNYKTQKSFPSIIINYNQSTNQQYPDWFIRRPPIGNMMKIPILYDSTKDLSLLVQEAHYEHSISMSLNCESIMQLLELQHRIELYLPVGKHIEPYNFYTFLEIPQYFINSLMFDINRDTIYNLFTKRDLLTNEIIQMCSIKYDPLIRLESMVPNSISTDNKSFSLSLDFTVINPVPMYFEIPEEEIPAINKNIKQIEIPEICLPIFENIPVVKFTFRDSKRNLINRILPLLNIDENNNFKTFFKYDNNGYQITGSIKNKFQQFSGKIESNKHSYNVNVKIYTTNNNQYKIYINDNLSGEIVNPDWDGSSEYISGLFTGKFDLNTFDKDIFVELVNLTLDLNTKIVFYELDNIDIELLTNNDDRKTLILIDYYTIPYGKLTLFYNEYNDSRLNLIVDKTLVTNIGYYDNDTTIAYDKKYISNLTENDIINVVAKNRDEYFSINGFINPYTWNYTLDQNNQYMDYKTVPVYLLITATFDNKPKFGATYIDAINFDIAPSFDNYNYLTTNTKMFHDFNFDEKKNANSKILYSTVIPFVDDFLYLDDEFVYINLSPIDNININNIVKLHWSLLFRDRIYTDLNSAFELKPIFKKPFLACIALQIPKKEYILNFSKYKDTNQIFYFKLFDQIGAINANISE